MNKYIQTPWTSAENLVDQLKIGDLIEIKRCIAIGIPIYYHWAIYVGLRNGIHEVVHFTNKEDDSRVLNSLTNLFLAGLGNIGKSSFPRIDNFLDVCYNDKCRINNSMDKHCKPLQAEDIRSRALSAIGNFEYCVFSYNCEHFAKWARYNLSISGQANIGKAIMASVATFRIFHNIYFAIACGVVGYVVLEVCDFVRKRRHSKGSNNYNHSKKQLAVLPA
uniref:LRAT domain-containing protein n=1 Tax=Strongyloides papillosus TaxID=174720 RepID=A0A0N5BI12_STREA